MSRHSVSALAALALALLCAAVGAQPVADVPPPPRLSEPPGAARAASPAVQAPTPAAKATDARPEAHSEARSEATARSPARAASAVPSNIRVIEDDDVRIEESRGQRGQLQRITVRSKTGGNRAYEIVVGPGGQDPSQPRGNTGQRAWSLFDF